MDYGAIIATAISSASFMGFIQYLIIRHDRKNDDLSSIKKDLKLIKDSQRANDVRVTRIELKGLIRDDPDNIDAILQVAESYFIELDGNAYAHAIFEKWAIEHGVSTGWLPKLKKGGKYGNQS